MKRRLAIGAALVAVLAAAATTYALAASGASTTQTLNACVDRDGLVRLVAIAGDCRKGETPVSWNTVGPQGAQGPQGIAGRDGQTGPQGPAGVAGTSVPSGTIIFLLRGTPAPSGYTLIGSFDEVLNTDGDHDRDDKRSVTFLVYRKN